MDTITQSNKKWKHFIDAENKTYKTALVDGYHYGDRLLEGVMFEITVEDTGDLSIKVEDSAKDYFSQFNEEHWYTTILESVEKNCEAMIRVGKHDFDDVQLVSDNNTQATTQKKTPVPITVQKLNASELFKNNDDFLLGYNGEKLKIGKYENIADLINSNPDLKQAWDNDQGGVCSIEDYMDENWDEDDIEMCILTDLGYNDYITTSILIDDSKKTRNDWDWKNVHIEVLKEIKNNTVNTITPNTVNNLNNTIQNMNNGKTNITSNPALNDLGIVDDVEDPEYAEYSIKIENFHTSIKESITEKTEKIDKLNKIIHKNDYWDAHYGLELYNAILTKFFSKEYLTHPKERFKKVQTFLEEIIYKFNAYLVSISYNIKTEEDIEADVKEYIAKTLLEEHFAISKKEPVKKEKEVKENINFADLGANLTEEKKSKLSDILRKMEAGESLEKEKEATAIKELSEYDKADLKGKIAIKYAEVHKRAIELDGEEDGLIKTYVEGLYNPATTFLDDKNLLLNLLIVSKMQDISIMKWEFDERRVKVSNTEIDLKHNWWTKILTEEIEEDLKYVKIVEKDLNLVFYTSLFSDLIKKADKLSYSERNLKFKKLLSDGDEDTSREGLLLDTLLKKTNEGSVLFITPDMEKWVQTENVVNDELGDKGQIRYIGVWKERHIFVINVDKIRGLEQYSNEIIFLNKGNGYVLNPEKPIVYFNVIENPFLERPLIKWYAGAEFDISMDKAARMRVDNNFLE